jgi:hypothetical protein
LAAPSDKCVCSIVRNVVGKCTQVLFNYIKLLKKEWQKYGQMKITLNWKSQFLEAVNLFHATIHCATHTQLQTHMIIYHVRLSDVCRFHVYTPMVMHVLTDKK